MSRLTTRMRVDALMRRVRGEGGFATVLHHGDDTAGSLILVTRTGAAQSAWTRTLGASGYQWTVAARDDEATPSAVGDYIARQMKYDPDLWAVELDIANAERFVAESSGD